MFHKLYISILTYLPQIYQRPMGQLPDKQMEGLQARALQELLSGAMGLVAQASCFRAASMPSSARSISARVWAAEKP